VVSISVVDPSSIVVDSIVVDSIVVDSTVVDPLVVGSVVVGSVVVDSVVVDPLVGSVVEPELWLVGSSVVVAVPVVLSSTITGPGEKQPPSALALTSARETVTRVTGVLGLGAGRDRIGATIPHAPRTAP
jgi:hypothetical protein